MENKWLKMCRFNLRTLYGAIAQNPLLRLTKLCILMGLLLRALYCVSPSCAYLGGYCSERSIASHQAVHTYGAIAQNPPLRLM